MSENGPESIRGTVGRVDDLGGTAAAVVVDGDAVPVPPADAFLMASSINAVIPAACRLPFRFRLVTEGDMALIPDSLAPPILV